MRTLDRSFAGGEITPEMFGRIDLTSFQTGLSTCRNFVVLPHGPVENRAGTEFVREVKTSARRTRLIPFAYSTSQTMVLEMGHQYIRFHTNGGTLLSGGVPYEIVTPYQEADLFDLHYVQSADVMTIAHPNYETRELRRLGATNWTLTVITFAPVISAPASVNATASGDLPATLPPVPGVTISSSTAGPDTPTYYVTAYSDNILSESSPSGVVAGGIDQTLPVTLQWKAVGGAQVYRVYRDNYMIGETTELTLIDDENAENTSVSFGVPSNGKITTKNDFYVATNVSASGEESYQSVSDSAFNDLTIPGLYNIITPASFSGAVSCNIYKLKNGIYGYIGSVAPGIGFIDDNIDPDMTRSPPVSATPFTGAGNYPGAVSYFEQRRLFAGTINQPQNMWMTRTGTESNLSTSTVTRADDAVSFRIAALTVSTIRHIVPLGEIILLTSSSEWRVTSADNGGITPTTVRVRPQSYIGASNATPAVTNSSMLYAAARGGHIREILYTMADNGAVGYGNSDMSILAPHLFDYKTVVDLAFSKAPYSILWAVSSDGRLLGMTYVPEQKVAGWHRHDTDGLFESCAVVAEGDEDRLYVVVQRTINGSSKRYVERLHTRQFEEAEDAFFVDCGDTYSGAAVTTISGLSHLEGKQVAVLGNGATFPLVTVSGGSITIDVPVTLAHIGLPITAEIKTLPMSTEQLEAFGQGRAKNVSKVYMRVYRSSGILAGPNENQLTPFKQRTTEAFGSPPRLIESAEIEISVGNNWTTNGQVVVRQDTPLPVTVLSMALETSVGG